MPLTDSQREERMRQRVRPDRYRVERHAHGTTQMVRGLGASEVRWEEPNTWAYIYEGTRLIDRVNLNSLTCCLPNLPSGEPGIRGMEATDEQLILAIVGDESIFATDEEDDA